MAFVERAVLREIAADVVQAIQAVAQACGVHVPARMDAGFLGRLVGCIGDVGIEALVRVRGIVEVLPEVRMAQAVVRILAGQRGIQAAEFVEVELRQAAGEIGQRAVRLVQPPGAADQGHQRLRGIVDRVAVLGRGEDRARIVDQEAARGRQVAAQRVVAGQAAGTTGAAAGGQHLGGPWQVVLQPAHHCAHIAHAVVVPHQRRVLPARVVVDRHAVAAVDVAGAVGDVDHVPALRLHRIERADAGDEGADQARARVQQAHVVVGNAVGIACAAYAGLAGAAGVVPAGATALHVDDGIARIGHAVDEELEGRAVAADRAGRGRQLDGLPGVVTAGLEAVAEAGRVGQQRIAAGALRGGHLVVGLGRRDQVHQGLPEAVVAFFGLEWRGDGDGERCGGEDKRQACGSYGCNHDRILRRESVDVQRDGLPWRAARVGAPTVQRRMVVRSWRHGIKSA